MILLDTHVLLWLAEGNEKLGRRARGRIDKALHASTVGVTAITYWEIAMLVQKGRLNLSYPVSTLRRRVVESGVVEFSMDGAGAIQAAELQAFHGDPADRMIVATALDRDAALCTADKKILTWRGKLRTLNADR